MNETIELTSDELKILYLAMGKDDLLEYLKEYDFSFKGCIVTHKKEDEAVCTCNDDFVDAVDRNYPYLDVDEHINSDFINIKTGTIYFTIGDERTVFLAEELLFTKKVSP